MVSIRVRNHEQNRARKIFWSRTVRAARNRARSHDKTFFAISNPGFDIHFPFFLNSKIFQFYNWPREISRDDVTKINLLWIKITFLDYLTPFIPNGLTIPLRPSSALNQEIQSAFGFVTVSYICFAPMMDFYISHAFSYPNFFPWKVIFWVFEFQKKNKCRRITIFEFHFWFLPQWRIQPRVHDYLTAVHWISAPLQLAKFNHWTNFSWKLWSQSDPYLVKESWTRQSKDQRDVLQEPKLEPIWVFSVRNRKTKRNRLQCKWNSVLRKKATDFINFELVIISILRYVGPDGHDFEPNLIQKWVGVTIWFWRCNKRKGYTLIWSWLRLDIWWFCSIESTMKSAAIEWLSREHFRPIKFNLERRTVPNRIKPRVSSNVKNILFYQKHVT